MPFETIRKIQTWDQVSVIKYDECTLVRSRRVLSCLLHVLRFENFNENSKCKEE